MSHYFFAWFWQWMQCVATRWQSHMCSWLYCTTAEETEQTQYCSNHCTVWPPRTHGIIRSHSYSSSVMFWVQHMKNNQQQAELKENKCSPKEKQLVPSLRTLDWCGAFPDREDEQQTPPRLTQVCHRLRAEGRAPSLTHQSHATILLFCKGRLWICGLFTEE